MRHPLRLGCRRAVLFLLVVVAALSIGPRQADARSIGEILAEHRKARNALIEAYRQYGAGDVAGASATLQNALVILDGVRDELPDPSVAELLQTRLEKALKKVGVFRKRIVAAQIKVENGKVKAKVVLNKLKSAWKFGRKSASAIGRPLIEARKANYAGILGPGREVQFRIAVPDGCAEPVHVVVENGGLAQAVNLSTVFVDQASGLVSMRLGYEKGSANIEVSACGRSENLLVFNDGPKIPKGLPNGFPTNLAKGRYRRYYSIDGGPTVEMGTVKLTNLKAFSKQIKKSVNRATAAISIPGCSWSVSYGAAQSHRFSVTFTMTCTVGDYSASSTGVMVVEKI